MGSNPKLTSLPLWTWPNMPPGSATATSSWRRNAELADFAISIAFITVRSSTALAELMVSESVVLDMVVAIVVPPVRRPPRSPRTPPRNVRVSTVSHRSTAEHQPAAAQAASATAALAPV